MRGKFISYFAAVFLNLALVGLLAPSSSHWRLSRPGVVRLFEGARVTAEGDRSESAGVRIGLLLEGRLHLAAADPQENLFPRTALWLRSEPAVAVLN